MSELNKVSGEIFELKDYIRRLSKSDKLGFTEKIEYVKLELECAKIMYTMKLHEERMALESRLNSEDGVSPKGGCSPTGVSDTIPGEEFPSYSSLIW